MESHQKQSGPISENSALHLLQASFDKGVREFCICPGGRNVPLIALLKLEPSLRCYYHNDERSAAFFALGRSRATHRPVAVVTTSGSAPAHLLPAAMEAYYTEVPLLLISTDRPRRFRGTNSPQSCEQVGLFGHYAPFEIDIAGDEPCDLSGWSMKTPAHVNICFEEPNNRPIPTTSGLNLDEKRAAADSTSFAKEQKALNTFLDKAENLFVIVGKLADGARAPVADFLLRLGAPLHLEGVSGLREDPRLQHLVISRGEKIWGAAAKEGYPIKSILRIGGVPTFRMWRDIEEKEGSLDLFSLNSAPFSGLSWGPITPACPKGFFEGYAPQRSHHHEASARWIAADAHYRRNLEALCREEPTAEPSLIHALSLRLPQATRVYLGNGLSIRSWDLAAARHPRNHELFASRGLNGIDGQISTFFGLCDPARPNWAILGDLTALHDLGAPWILPQLKEMHSAIAVMNNGGGKIFSRIFPHKEIQNLHSLNFKPFAEMWGMAYAQWHAIPEKLPASNHSLIEIIPDNSATERFWTKLGQI